MNHPCTARSKTHTHQILGRATNWSMFRRAGIETKETQPRITYVKHKSAGIKASAT